MAEANRYTKLWVALELLSVMSAAGEDDGMFEVMEQAVCPVSWDEFRGSQHGDTFYQLHPCTHHAFKEMLPELV